MVGERAPRGEVLEPLALLGAERVERRLPGGRPGRGEHDLERRLLGLPRGVAVDGAGVGVEVAHRVERPLDERAVGRGQVPRLADVLDPDVQRVDEAAARREVGRGRHRGAGLGGVQRVDEDEVRAGLVRGEPGQVRQVGQVADAPGRARPHRVQLGHEAPRAAFRDGCGQLEPLRRHDERRARVGAVALGVQVVPPEGQVGRDLERRAADAPTVDRARLDEQVELAEVAALARRARGVVAGRAAVATLLGLELDPDVDGGAVLDVHGDRHRVPLPDDHGRGSIWRHASSRECSRLTATFSGDDAGTPRASSTATRVEARTWRRVPSKSQKSDATPWASASCTNGSGRSVCGVRSRLHPARPGPCGQDDRPACPGRSHVPRVPCPHVPPLLAPAVRAPAEVTEELANGFDASNPDDWFEWFVGLRCACCSSS